MISLHTLRVLCAEILLLAPVLRCSGADGVGHAGIALTARELRAVRDDFAGVTLLVRQCRIACVIRRCWPIVWLKWPIRPGGAVQVR